MEQKRIIPASDVRPSDACEAARRGADTRRDQCSGLTDLLDRLEQIAGCHERVTLDDIMETVGRRSFGPLLLLAGLILVLPVVGDIPGVPTVFGVFVLLVVVQLLAGRDHFWLPRWLLDRSVSGDKLRRMVKRWLKRPARVVERSLKTRLAPLFDERIVRLMAACCAILALLTPITEFIPFSANGVGAGWIAFGVGIVTRDGLLALTGFVFFALTVCVVIAVVT